MLFVGLEEVMELYWEWPIQKYGERIGIRAQDIVKIVRLLCLLARFFSVSYSSITETTSRRVQYREEDVREDRNQSHRNI